MSSDMRREARREHRYERAKLALEASVTPALPQGAGQIFDPLTQKTTIVTALAQAVQAALPARPSPAPQEEKEHVFSYTVNVVAHEVAGCHIYPPQEVKGVLRLDGITFLRKPASPIWISAIYAGLRVIYPTCDEEKEICLREEELSSLGVFCDLYRKEPAVMSVVCPLYLQYFAEQDDTVQIILRGRERLTIGK